MINKLKINNNERFVIMFIPFSPSCCFRIFLNLSSLVSISSSFIFTFFYIFSIDNESKSSHTDTIFPFRRKLRKLSYTSDETDDISENEDNHVEDEDFDENYDYNQNYVYIDSDSESESDSMNEFINDSENLTEYSSEDEIETSNERLRSKKK